MNTEHFQKSTAYLDGLLLCLPGCKVVTITYGALQQRFHITPDGEVSQWGEEGPLSADGKAFELYRMTFLEALLEGGSVIIRQLAVGQLNLPAELGGGQISLDYLSGAAVSSKGIRGLRAEELRRFYALGAPEQTEFRDLPSKEQVKIALMRRVELDAEAGVTEAVA